MHVMYIGDIWYEVYYSYERHSKGFDEDKLYNPELTQPFNAKWPSNDPFKKKNPWPNVYFIKKQKKTLK